MARPIMKKINEDVFQMYKPGKERPDCEVVFFHGFELGDSRESYWTDWTSTDRSHCWPQTLLVEKFPGARDLSASFDSNLVNGRADLTGIARKLISSLILTAEVGQSGCPVVLVGHSVGGLVMKRLCVMAGAKLNSNEETDPVINFVPLKNFLRNLKGLLFYATPHTGSTFISQNLTSSGWKGRLINSLEVMNEETLHLNEEFQLLRLKFGWRLSGAAETLPTKLGSQLNGLVVSEASSRIGMDVYFFISADHIEICKGAGNNVRVLLSLIEGALQQREVTVPDEIPKELPDAGPNDPFADPTTWKLMLDPVTCNDGTTYDRSSLVNQNLTESSFTREKIVVELVDVHAADSFFQSLSWYGRTAKSIYSGSTITVDNVFSKLPKEIAPDSGVYQIHTPETEPELEVVFFHGLEFHDFQEAYWKDWTSSDQSQCWPKTWLVEEFPKARVLSVSYNSNLMQRNDRVDMHIMAETLSRGLIKGLVGQSSNCPVVLVGHSLGGLVMKHICLHFARLADLQPSDDLRGLAENFSRNLKGLFFYATPHLGSKFISQNMTDTLFNAPIAELMKIHSVSAVRDSTSFSLLQKHRGWNVYGVGEMHKTELGYGIRGIVVQKESARHGMGQCYSSIPANHFNICKPDDKNGIGFQLLARFIRGILQQSSITTPDGTSAAT